MDKKQLDDRLRELHNELKKIESVDEKELRILEQLNTDIQAILDQEEYNQEHSYDQLKSALEQLATSHPNLTTIIGRIADMFAKMGI